MAAIALEQAGTWVRHYAELVLHLVRRDFEVRYTGSILGLLWSVLLPLSQLLVLVFVFERVVPLGIEAYPAFVFSALLPWTWFSSSVGASGGLFMTHRDLVRRPHFKPAVIVVMNTISNLLTYLAGLPLLLAILFIYGRWPTEAYLVLPVLIVLQAVLTIGLSLVVATWNVFYRDVQHLVSVALSLWFYLTPIFYELPIESSLSGVLFAINPMALIVQSHRVVLFEGKYPEPMMLALAALWSLAILGLGYFVYRYRQDDILDEL